MLLTADEEVALGRRARRGDLAARNELVERNRRFARSLAHGYARRCRCYDDDLYQAANLGLVRGANAFDPQAYPNTKFSAIARHYIRAELLSYLYGRQLVRVPHNMRPGEIKNHPLETTKPRWKATREWAIQCAARASSRVQQHEDEEQIVDRSQPWSELESSRAETVEMVEAALDRLPPLHEDIVRRRFGIGVPRQTARAIAQEYGTSRESVYNLQRRALTELREAIA